MKTKRLKFLLWTSLSLLFAINCSFVYKYASRTAIGALPSLIGFSALYWAGIVAVIRYGSRPKVRSALYRFIIPAWMFLLFAALFVVKEATLKVDRYAMIDLFWNNLFSGLNPYMPREVDTNVPAPFPFYFILFLPFKLLGDIGPAVLLATAGLLILIGQRKDPAGLKPLALFILVISPAFAFEVVTRSTVFVNAFLAILLFALLRSANFSRWKQVIIAGLCAGAVASTRAVTLLWLMAGFLYYARTNSWKFRSVLSSGLIAAAAFLAPLAILYACFPDSFRLYNPFRVQSDFMPLWFAPVALASFAAAGLLVKSEPLFYFCLGFASYGILIPYMVDQFARHGFHKAIFENQIDVSYQVFCLPFFIAALMYAGSKEKAVNS